MVYLSFSIFFLTGILTAIALERSMRPDLHSTSLPEQISTRGVVVALALVALQLLIIAFVNGFTTPKSPLRLLGLPVVACLAWYLLNNSFELTGSSALGGMIGAPPIGFLLQYLDTALIGKWDIAVDGPHRIIERKAGTSAKPLPLAKYSTHANGAERGSSDFEFWSRLRFGFRSTIDIRGVNRPWESKHVPPHSQSDPELIPSRTQFLPSTILKVGADVGIAHYVSSCNAAFLCELCEPCQWVYSPKMVHVLSRLSAVSWCELPMRMLVTAKELLLIKIGLELAYDLVAILIVAGQFMEPRDLRPLFNSPWEAYTVRRFWRYVNLESTS